MHEVTGMLNKLTLEKFEPLSRKLLESIGSNVEVCAVGTGAAPTLPFDACSL
jgi:ABC-type tungstate transport system permease subunit